MLTQKHSREGQAALFRGGQFRDGFLRLIAQPNLGQDRVDTAGWLAIELASEYEIAPHTLPVIQQIFLEQHADLPA